MWQQFADARRVCTSGESRRTHSAPTRVATLHSTTTLIDFINALVRLGVCRRLLARFLLTLLTLRRPHAASAQLDHRFQSINLLKYTQQT